MLNNIRHIKEVYELRTTEARVLEYCATMQVFGKKGKVYPKYQTIADALGVHRSTAIRAMNRLVELGLVSRKKQNYYNIGFKGWRQTSNLYKLAKGVAKFFYALFGSGERKVPVGSQNEPPKLKLKPINNNNITNNNLLTVIGIKKLLKMDGKYLEEYARSRNKDYLDLGAFVMHHKERQTSSKQLSVWRSMYNGWISNQENGVAGF